MRQQCKADLFRDFRRRRVEQLLAVGDVGDGIALHGFVHVVRGDERGDALRRVAADRVPEIAPRFGIDAGGGFVEQQQFRLVDHARGEREALLPAAGELARELRLAFAQDPDRPAPASTRSARRSSP